MRASRPVIAAIVLAAGESTRLAPANKLLVDWRGIPVVRRVVQTVTSLEPVETLVVLGHEAPKIEDALMAEPVRFVVNPRYREGMGTSIAAGVAAVRADVEGFLIVPGDLPELTFTSLESLLDAFQGAGPGSIAVCATSEGWMSPALFGSNFRHELVALGADEGAKSILRANVARVVEVRVPIGELRDIDTADDLK